MFVARGDWHLKTGQSYACTGVSQVPVANCMVLLACGGPARKNLGDKDWSEQKQMDDFVIEIAGYSVPQNLIIQFMTKDGRFKSETISNAEHYVPLPYLVPN